MIRRHPVAVVHGRFQPLHDGHLEYLLAAARRCDTLVVGITNPDPDWIACEDTDPNRSAPESNPFTYYERYLMIESALRDAGVAAEHLRIVPFPHSFPARLHHYSPSEAIYLITIYDQWGEEKLKRFVNIGLTVEVMWRRQEKPISGQRVRQAIANNEPWQHLVPPAVVGALKEAQIGDRIRM